MTENVSLRTGSATFVCNFEIARGSRSALWQGSRLAERGRECVSLPAFLSKRRPESAERKETNLVTNFNVFKDFQKLILKAEIALCQSSV